MSQKNGFLPPWVNVAANVSTISNFQLCTLLMIKDYIIRNYLLEFSFLNRDFEIVNEPFK